MNEMELNSNVDSINIYPAEMGKIKLGEKGKKYFGEMKIRKNYQAKDQGGNLNFVAYDEVMNKYSKEGKPLKEIDIKLPFNDIKLCLFSRFTQRTGKVVTGKGDGTNFYKLDQPSGKWEKIEEPTLQLQDSYKGTDKWKLITIFNCYIVGFERIGSVFVQRGTSFNNYRALRSSLESLSSKTKGQLTEITYRLSVEKARNSVSNHNQIFLDYIGTDLKLAREAFNIKTEFAKYDFDNSELEKKLKKLTEADGFIESRFNDADSDEEFHLVQKDDVKEVEKLSDKENTMPDLDEKEDVDEKAILAEIAKMQIEAMNKVEDTTTTKGLKELKQGIGYPADAFKGYEKQADQVISVVINAINAKIDTLKEAKKDYKEELSQKLIKYGLSTTNLRNRFYTNYPMDAEKYINDENIFNTNIEAFKIAMIEPLIIDTDKMVDANGKDGSDDVKKSWEATDKNNFVEVYSFWEVMKKQK